MYKDSEERKAIEGFDETLREAQTLVDLIEVMARSSQTLDAILGTLRVLFVVTSLSLGIVLGALITIAWG